MPDNQSGAKPGPAGATAGPTTGTTTGTTTNTTTGPTTNTTTGTTTGTTTDLAAAAAAAAVAKHCSQRFADKASGGSADFAAAARSAFEPTLTSTSTSTTSATNAATNAATSAATATAAAAATSPSATTTTPDATVSTSSASSAAASLLPAVRRIIETVSGHLPLQDLDLHLAELLQAIWSDPDWRKLWGTEEVQKPCPIHQIVTAAHVGLSYGDKEANRKYFKQFGRLALHATMLQDKTRTGTYQRAILQNPDDFRGKVVMDVGSGTGLLAFFALQAGASKVYCVEASPMSTVIEELAAANGFSSRVVIVNAVLQEIRSEVPEKVDVIVHETLGNFLFAERGIETVIAARERFLKPGGLLFPAAADFCLAPFEDSRAHAARLVKAKNLWTETNFFGIDLSSQHRRSLNEAFNKPLFDQFHPDILRADAQVTRFDFRTMQPQDVQKFSVPLNFESKSTCIFHGLAGWFEAIFEGTNCTVVLSTSPWDTLTHWWQVRLMLLEPLAINRGQQLLGKLDFAPAVDTNTYVCRLSLAAGGVERVQDGYNLADVDSASQAPTMRIHKISATEKVSMIDWEATKAAPTATECLVSDPRRALKDEALRSQQNRSRLPQDSQQQGRQPASASAYASASSSPAGAPSGSGSGSGSASASASAAAPSEVARAFGSQISVRDKTYVLMHEPSMAQNVLQQGSLSVVGCMGAAVLLAPPTLDVVLEIVPTTGQTITRIWLQQAQARTRMLEIVGRASRITGEELQKLDPRQLVSLYVEALGGAATAKSS